MGLTVCVDGDDTLWENEPIFARSYEHFDAVVSDHARIPVREALLAVERRNLATFGYGVKSFTLSMIEAAIEVTDGTVPTSVIAGLVDVCRDMLQHPVELLDGVAEVIPQLAERWPVLLVTKGDLLHQESKVAQCGLAEFFGAVQIVSEKDPSTYRQIASSHGIDVSDLVMVGDSRRSDIDAVLEAGGWGIHVPQGREWEHDVAAIGAHHDERWWVVSSMWEVPGIIEVIADRASRCGAQS